MKKNLVVVDYGFNTDKVFRRMFASKTILDTYIPYVFREDDVLILEGGTDISSFFYGEKPNRYTSKPDRKRDIFESALVEQAISKGIPIIGICRGAQLVCALSGGSLIQHVNRHGVDHPVIDYKGRSYQVTSSHHQMMFPKNTKHRILASCKEATIYIGEGEKLLDIEEDAEIVWFEDTKALAIQGHPEWANPDSKFVECCREYVSDFILKGN